MKWIELEIFTTLAASEAVTNILTEFGIEGLSKERPADSSSEAQIIIKAYLADNQSSIKKITEIEERIKDLPAYGIDITPGKVAFERILAEDWHTSWQQHFKPRQITEKLAIKPTWADYQPSNDQQVIELDPGRAFGTGLHATTTMCLEAIEEYSLGRESLLDLGSGTGILSIAAALLGMEKVLAVDIDEVAVEAAKENIELNGVQNKVEVRQGSLTKEVDEKFDLVVANILPHIIWELIADLKQVLAENSLFILSGINIEKKSKLQKRLKEFELTIMKIKEREDWVTFIGQRGESNG
ncbi:50S ribosomal protein L11 methyltransferase [Fuchsiella alkaliacetigena]|uniref:50S ribosomal protein L11 methyltransferase n=1 Tax=Fuchsiella alkaliacetigena TaxID=957042 RepID=UPI00200AA3D0|nr:50S ribosomal protein L11 methyltransferase [Fuchsiella alkaliacetigena]MCK8825150.1 50S ribosomal protein L11 methyltransferase [Fuchsiella alkaliacetigena]